MAIASTIDEAEQLESKLDRDRASEQILQAVDYLLSHKAVKGKGIGMIAFSLGGYLGLGLLDKRPETIGAVVVFYAARRPNLAKTRAAFQGHFAEDDKYEPTEGVKEFEEALRKAKKEVEFHIYPGTKHWFFEENRPEFNRKAADLAWKRAVQFLHTKLM